MKLALFGPPGSGKGTQAMILSKMFDIPHVSTGEIFRYHMKEQTPLGIETKKYMDEGQLVPDEIVVKIIIDKLESHDCSRGYLLDGFPRTLNQAEAFDKYLKENNSKLFAAINLQVSDDEIIRRMSGRRICVDCQTVYNSINGSINEGQETCPICHKLLHQRDDDKPEVVQERLKVYHTQTEPLIKYYQNIIINIQGSGSVEEVTKNILDDLGITEL